MTGQSISGSNIISLETVQKGAVKLEYIPTDEQVADILTKALPRGKHVYFRDKIGVVRNTFLGKREC